MKKFTKYDIRVIIENKEFDFNREERFETEKEVTDYIRKSLGEVEADAYFERKSIEGFRITETFVTKGLHKFLVTIIDQRIGF